MTGENWNSVMSDTMVMTQCVLVSGDYNNTGAGAAGVEGQGPRAARLTPPRVWAAGVVPLPPPLPASHPLAAPAVCPAALSCWPFPGCAC
jgi:hypothetical protein